MSQWDARQYLKFGDERTRAAAELLARVPLSDAGEVVDLGCGPGNSSALLRARWPHARIRGIDSSPQMLEQARREVPSVEWIQADAANWQPQEPVDVLYANAVFHWLPDHDRLLPRLISALAPGGVLAVQMPCNFEEPSHRLMRQLPGPWEQAVAEVRALQPVARPAFYYDVLAPHCSSIDIWQTTYEHVMADEHAIVEWVRGTGLRPYLDAVADEQRRSYLDAYTRAIEQAYRPRIDGKRLFSFPRLFFVAVR
ncbi:MAG TPA: trans-aconitate 2-methyltransferase [Candidatus Limnocylindrales bacterium]|nr:trans-aconitate 2-methyltransferase [Candidatus Limnocylindrales bacterium]